jgi:photosynthetic reaction center cytochrome c subunit
MVRSVNIRWWLFGGILTLAFGLLVCGVLVLRWLDRSQQTDPVQSGYRGTGMAQIYSDATLQAQAVLQAPPPIASAARARPGGPVAGKVYKNVQVLGDLPLGEFGRTMTEITNWIAPQASCVYCHVEGNFVSDDKYTKVVARRMFQMVQQINGNWKSHVAGTGVTCYTCHRGNALPQQRWFRQVAAAPGADFIGGKSIPHQVRVRGGSLPDDPLGTFLLSETAAPSVRVASPRVLAQFVGQPIPQAEQTYALMMHVSQSLGVNCSFCHNTRAFSSWEQSSPQRQTAWYGIRMVREINAQFMEPLSSTFPATATGRLGPAGDAAKVHCGTCHLGANKPLYGAQMAQYYPALLLAPQAASAPPVAASAAQPQTEPEPAAVEAAASAAAKTQVAASAAVQTVVAAAVPPAVPAKPATVASPQPQPAPTVPAAPRAAVASAVPVLPPVVAVAPQPVSSGAATNSACAALADSAGKLSVSVPAAQGQRQVKGKGRLQFFSAPASTCAMKGIFILPAEAVTAYASQAGYMRVKYVNPRTGFEVTGWVEAQRVAPD